GELNLTASVPGNASYNWLKGSTKIQGSVLSIDVNQSGSYILTASANGCSANSEPVNVQVYSAGDPACTTGINETQLQIKVYPNPFKGSFTLETSFNENKPVIVELFDATGALVKAIQLNQYSGKTNIPVSTPGFYSLRINTGNGIKIFKIVGN
ncbi:MAG TPA: T9SS type A sorting domain-containing protein, partial [Draconibacterium sp.]|nr:T9SS type A sorting domain-containing protein [Draconibacterium sp.]